MKTRKILMIIKIMMLIMKMMTTAAKNIVR